MSSYHYIPAAENSGTASYVVSSGIQDYSYTTASLPALTSYSYESGSNSLSAGNLIVSGGSSSSGTVSQVAQDLLALGAAGGAASGSSAGVSGGSTTTYVVTGGSGLATSASSSRLDVGGAFNNATNFSGSGLATSSSGSGGRTISGVVENSTVLLLTAGSSGSKNTTVLEASAYSALEQAILQASRPFDVAEQEVITINGQTGIWANKQEVVNWRGVIPITQYLINEDAQPEVIRKHTDQVLTYEQEIAIRYLRPPTPPPPGEIVIRQEKNIPTPPAPPLVIRQQPPRPETPAPLVIREAPPTPPASIGQKIITISGKRLSPPPRKVIVERLAPLPSKPQSVIIERWLPYSQRKRRVIFQRPTEADPVIPRPRNVIVQWETPQVQIKKSFRDLGVVRANPVEYVQTYGASLKSHVELPEFVRELKPPSGVVLAAEHTQSSLIELEGDVQALSLIDLDREGLGEYRSWFSRFASGSSSSVSGGTVHVSGGGSSSSAVGGGSVVVSGGGSSAVGGSTVYVTGGGLSSSAVGGGSVVVSGGGGSVQVSGGGLSTIGSGYQYGAGETSSGVGIYYIAGGAHAGSTGTYTILKSASGTTVISLPELFQTLDRDSNGFITRDEANAFLLNLNTRLGRIYGQKEANAFFNGVDINSDGKLSFEEFRIAVLRQFS